MSLLFRNRARRRGFGIIETLISLFLVGVVLGLVGRGYQALNRLSLASYSYSQRMEQIAFLQRLSYEVAPSITLELDGADGFEFARIDPNLNLRYREPVKRLPWPIPPPATSTGLNLPAYLVTTKYTLDRTEKVIRREANGVTTTSATGVGDFRCDFRPAERSLQIEVRPSDLTPGTRTKVYLPVLAP